ncbi:MAG: ABC transporter permease [Deltaproteobacteria bacterium]|nr:ABC transporter permease [Deltaproteobacteria bacterium]MBI3294608.1 ABC transporter permease [Deltaproteobacteria bacterium]
MGGILCERSGVATICLEGAMLWGAFVAAIVAHYLHSPWSSIVPCLVGGALVLGIHAFATQKAKADHIISGLVVNLLVAGSTPLLCKFLFGSPTNSPNLARADRFHELAIPFLSALPGVGFIFEEMPLTYLALILPFVLHRLLFRSRFGLRITAAGEDPDTLLSCGVKPDRVRWVALCLGGALAALGGAFLSVSHASQFTRDMTSGRGYIALTALIFGNWRPLPTLLSCLLFGFADALQIRLQSAEMIPIQFIQALPYLFTLVVLVGFVGKARPPSAIGRVS